MHRDLWNVLADFIYEATEDELDEALRSSGQDPEEVVRRAEAAISSAIERSGVGTQPAHDTSDSGDPSAAGNYAGALPLRPRGG